ncbi:MAG: GNAT family N-acetyltransferase, partial [Victivallaceae bacterium]
IDARTQEELAEHANAWNELLKETENAPPLVSYPWISAFFQHKVIPGERWLCIFIYENDKLSGVFPLIAGYSGRFLFCSILLLKLPYNVLHTRGIDFLVRQGREEIIDVLISYFRHKPGVYPLFSYKYIPENSVSLNYFERRENRFCTIKRPVGAVNVINMDDGFEKYYSGLSNSFRRNLRRCERKIETIPNSRFLIDDISRLPEDNLERFIEVEHRNWKGRNCSSLKNEASDVMLFRDAASKLTEAGLVRWDFLESENKTIAGQFSIRTKDKIHILKIGYDEDFAAFSPGNVLLSKTIEHCGCHVDFMSDSAWNDNWNPQPCPIFHLIALPRIPALSGICKILIKNGISRLFNGSGNQRRKHQPLHKN